MEDALLYVLHATVQDAGQIGSILRAARHARPHDSRCCLLLLCDLPDAGASVLPEDAPILRRLQSGVMAMNARDSTRFLLLVRRRVWDDAQRTYLGENQHISCRRIIAQLLSSGETDAVFTAATISPSTLKSAVHPLNADFSMVVIPS